MDVNTLTAAGQTQPQSDATLDPLCVVCDDWGCEFCPDAADTREIANQARHEPQELLVTASTL